VGDDRLDGSTGTDAASYATATAGITLSLAYVTAQATGGSGSDTLLNIENLIGSAYADVLTGNSLANSLAGGDGADTLFGGAGNDTMNGGYGDDTYYVDAAGDVVDDFDFDGESGIDLVISGIGATTLTQYIENLRLTSAAAANGTGNALANVIWAGAGNNVINGLGGTDTVSYSFATAGVTLTLGSVAAQATGGSGSDTLLNIENLTGSAYNDTLAGNGIANVLDGGGADDYLSGSGGNDSLYGGVGDDNLDGGVGDDRLDGGGGSVDTVSYQNAMSAVSVNLALATAQDTGGAGVDTVINVEYLTGSGYGDTLRGNSLANGISGGNGSDWLLGGGGIDTMVGGAGADLFVYSSPDESVLGAMDTIVDFNRFQSDKLDVSRIDANAALAGDQAFTYIGANSFSADATGQLRFVDGVLMGSTDADAEVEFAVYLSGSPTVLMADFLL
jgi:Ca2+-binding RTX toxin-like protein